MTDYEKMACRVRNYKKRHQGNGRMRWKYVDVSRGKTRGWAGQPMFRPDGECVTYVPMMAAKKKAR
jgi:hypothetical protein